MVAYHRVYDSRYVQADCQEPGSAPEPYAGQSSMGYLYPFLTYLLLRISSHSRFTAAYVHKSATTVSDMKPHIQPYAYISVTIICPSYIRHTQRHAYNHTHTHARARARARARLKALFSGTTRVSRYQKGKTNLDFTEARDS